ncbi:MAG: PfkB family carbohydrate kinase [Bacteroidia bacterium]|nr:PfkB family carbohydrate kinase [Bacteroidia bacterium]
MADHSKIVEITELAHIVSALRAEGRTVAHCHGCFDLVHLGHIKHFEAAHRAADVLIVTLTPDRYVNKGPGRPAFNEEMRLEMIAALEVVDYVALNLWPTAVETLHLLKPTYYVKGQEYKNFEEDLTGNIGKEVDAVRAGGGDIYFTEEVVFSSSKLINAHFSALDPSAQDYMQRIRQEYPAGEIVGLIDSLRDIRVLVVGDTIIDEYHYVRSLGKSSKSPTLSTKFLREDAFAGGVLAIANHLNQFAGKVHMVTCLGRENDHMEVIQPKLGVDIDTTFFYREDGPTPTKRRYISEYLNAKIFEVTFMNDENLPASLEEDIIRHLEALIPEVDMVLIADFGHGLITPRIRTFLEQADVFVAVNAQTNSNNYGYNYITKYRDVDYISIDENEIRLPFGDKYGNLESLTERLGAETRCPSITITLGQKGAMYYRDGAFFKAPGLSTTVVDSVGAGDAVLSVTALCAYKACPPELIPFIGNCTGALAVTILGNERPVNKVELTKMISHLLK